MCGVWGVKVRKTGKKGRGVFAERNYRPGETVTTCPVIVVPKAEIPDTHILAGYVFWWSARKVAVVLGLGMLFNHDDDHNLRFELLPSRSVVRFRARRNIAKGEELTISYVLPGDEPWFLRRKRAAYARGD